jgi:amidase
VADTASLLDVLAEPDPTAWNRSPLPLRPFAAEVGADPGRLRVRVCTENALGVPPEPACVEAVRRAGDLLADLGHEVVEGAPEWGDPGEFLLGFLTVWSTISAGSGLDPERLEPHNRANRSAAEGTDAISFLEASFVLQRASRALNAQFGADGDFDVLVTPTMGVEPPPVGSVWIGSEDDPGAPLLNCTPMAAYTAVFNVSGLPAISLPLHVSEAGLPVGVQFAGPPWGEDVLIRLASQVEAAAPWADRRPPIFG